MPVFVQSNFNGEWSPYMLARIQMARYAVSLRRMINYLPTIYGGARKRAGSEYLGAVFDETKKSRLHPFTFSNDESFLLEFGDRSLQFWLDGVALDADSLSYTNAQRPFSSAFSSDFYSEERTQAPYTEDQVPLLRFTGVNDLVYIAHPDHPIQELSRETAQGWVLGDFALTNEPYDIENSTDIAISSDGVAGGVKLTASEPLWTPSHVGTKIKMSHRQRQTQQETTAAFSSLTYYAPNPNWPTWSHVPTFVASTSVCPIHDRVQYDGNYYTCLNQYDFADDFLTDHLSPADYPEHFSLGIALIYKTGAYSATLNEGGRMVYGGWSFRTEGNWTGEWQIQASYDDGVTWETRYQMASSGGSDNYVREGNEEDEPCRLRPMLISGISTKVVTFTIMAHDRFGVVRIDAVNNATSVEGTVEEELFDQKATTKWQENEWNPRRGYPSQVFFHLNRLIAAGTRLKPQTIWGSRVDRWGDFKTGGVKSGDPFMDTLFSGQQNPIRWLSAQQELVVGMSGSLIALTGEEGKVLAPGKNIARRQGGKGSANLPPLEVDDITFYVQQGGRIIRGAGNNYERGVITAPDMTREAEHVTEGGILQMASQQNRDSLIYAVTGNGDLACLVFEPDQDKMGWVRLQFDGGTVESVAVLPTTTEEDEVYIIVKRTINSVERRYVERIKIGQIRVQEEGDLENAFGVDSGVTVTGTDLAAITGADHLEGEQVAVLVDGAVQEARTVVSGGFSLDEGTLASKVTYGKLVTSELWQMPLEGMAASGSSSGSKKRIMEMNVDLFQTAGMLEYSGSPDGDLSLLPLRDADDPTGSPSPAFTGSREVKVTSSRSFDGGLYLKHSSPVPCFIRKIVTKWEKTS